MGALSGKVAIVTGATSGIGERIAEVFVEEGANVVAAARRKTEGAALVQRLAACRTGGLEFCGEAGFSASRGRLTSYRLLRAPCGRLQGGRRGVCGAFGGRPPLQAGLRANIRLTFQAMVTRLHSPRAFSSPRIEN